MTTVTHGPSSQFEISSQSPKDAVLSDEDSVHSYVTDTVSIPDQETLNEGIEELVIASNEQNVNDCDDILAQISQYPEGSKDHGDNIVSQLGDIVNKMWSTTRPEERRKEKLNNYATPKYCQNWAVPKRNEDVWNVNLRSQMRLNDLGFERIQNMIIRPASVVMYTENSLTQCKNKKTSIPFGLLIEQLIDVIALLSHACHDFSQERKEAVKPALPKGCKNLSIMSQKIL